MLRVLTFGVYVAIILPIGIIRGLTMIIKTTVFDLVDGKYNNLSHLAQTMGISVSQVYRVKTGKRNINQKFITGAIQAFPQYRLDQLFYLALEARSVNNEQQTVTTRHHHMVKHYNNSPSPVKSS